MAFVKEQGSGRRSDVPYRDPMMNGQHASLGSYPQLGDPIGTGAATGAAFGTVVPGVGNVAGGAIGAIFGAISGIFGGGKDSTGLPQIPVNAQFANNLTTKWYELYAGHDPADSDRQHWRQNISEDGPVRAFVNFCKALRDSQGKDGLALSAQWATAGYGDYTVLGPFYGGTAQATGPVSTYPSPGMPNSIMPPNKLPMIGSSGMSTTTLLIIGGAILGGAYLLSRPRR